MDVRASELPKGRQREVEPGFERAEPEQRLLNAPARAATFGALVVASVIGFVLPAPGDAQGGKTDIWSLPAPGSCSAPRAGVPGEDAARFPFRSGDVVGSDRLASARSYFPEALWQHRELFFHEGMQLEVGPCFRDYGAPAFFGEATARSAARLTDEGGLENHRAGLPFPPASIERSDPRAAEKWAWNTEMRYRAAGFRGKFRVTDLSVPDKPEALEGEIFQMLLARRADLPGDDYRVPFADDELWVAGGSFLEPFQARDLAWRQYRPVEAVRDADRSDEVHAYLPQLRKVRRMSSARVEGLYLPGFGAGAVPNQQLAVGAGGGGAGPSGSSGGLGGSGGTGSGGAGGGAQSLGSAPAELGAQMDAGRSGFEDLTIRPNLWSWSLVGVRDVLAPINLARPVYPEAPDRSFGPSGLALSDRYDLRRAIVLEGRRKEGDRATDDPRVRVVYYVDLQTLVPLYSVVYGAGDEVAGVAMHAGRWSEDRPDYPRWPDDASRPVRVIDSVASLYAAPAGRGSWRRESWSVVATPPSDSELQALASVATLERGR